jgi:hypothetical protein
VIRLMLHGGLGQELQVPELSWMKILHLLFHLKKKKAGRG